MESLALVITVLLLIAILAGPLAIILSSKRLISFFKNTQVQGFPRVLIFILDALRKMLHLLLVLLGAVVGSQFLILQDLPLIPRLIGLFALVTSYIGLRREYFPEKFFFRTVRSKFKFSGKDGRSSGRDGFGPDGQN